MGTSGPGCHCWQQGPWGEAMGIPGHSPSLHPVEGPPCPESWPGQMPPSLVQASGLLPGFSTASPSGAFLPKDMFIFLFSSKECAATSTALHHFQQRESYPQSVAQHFSSRSSGCSQEHSALLFPRGRGPLGSGVAVSRTLICPQFPPHL